MYCPLITRVLLLSPVSGHDIAGGDVAFTEALLARPPEGVTYTTYIDALADGTLVERGRRPKHGTMRARDTVIFCARGIELALRRIGLLFREPYRYFTVDPDAFDLVHSHVFSLRLVESDPPLVISAGFPLSVLYEDRFHWSHRHVLVATWMEHLLARTFGVQVPWFPPRAAALSLVQSDHYRNSLIEAGADPRQVVVRTLAIDGTPSEPRSGPPQPIGFISTDFEGKGGRVVVDAFRSLLATHPDARLVIVGTDTLPSDLILPDGSVEWLGRVSRSEVLESVFPRIDVLVHPTRCDSGPPFVILEALQRAIPVITSDLVWIDEGLAGDGVRRVPGDTEHVSLALADLFDAANYGDASRAAVALWETRYSMDVLAGHLGDDYDVALGRLA